MTPRIGDLAPDFCLRDQFGQEVALSGLRGRRNVVLMFYPFAFSQTCSMELRAIRDRHTEFVNEDSAVLSVSCDSIFSLKAFAEQEGITHAMLSDFWPHGAVSRQYGAFLDGKGFATRATFVIDRTGIVRWCVVNGPGEARSADDYARALAHLR